MAKMNKVDFYSADKAMSLRVADFMRVRVYGATLQTRYKRDMADIDKKIEDTPRLLEGSIFANKIDEVIAELVAKKDEIKEKYDELRANAEKFVFTDADNEFYKNYKNGNITNGIIAWGKCYNIDFTNTVQLKQLEEAISGKKNANARTIITSGATQFTSARNKGDILKVMYGVLAEDMLKAGTLKPEALEADVVDFYATKKRK